MKKWLKEIVTLIQYKKKLNENLRMIALCKMMQKIRREL